MYGLQGTPNLKGKLCAAGMLGQRDLKMASRKGGRGRDGQRKERRKRERWTEEGKKEKRKELRKRERRKKEGESKG